MTAEVKDELSRLVVSAVSARRAEVTSLLRFAGGLHIVGGRVVVEAEVDLGSVARRLRKDIFDLYGYNAIVHVLSASGIRKTTRYVLRVANDGEALARQTGLLDLRGRPVRGLPAQVVGGSIADTGFEALRATAHVGMREYELAAEVEAVIARHPAVQEVCVFGVPDPYWGEAIKAVIVPRRANGRAAPSSLSDSAFHQLGFQAPYNVPIACNWGDLAIELLPTCWTANGTLFIPIIALTGASRPLSAGGEDEHSLQVPRHGHQTPFAAHFLQPAQ